MKNGPLRLAIKYVVYHKAKSLILVACIFLTLFLPFAIQVLLWEFDQKIAARAASTPVVLGARGSSLDLALNALYFKSDSAATIPYSEVESVRESRLADAIPIHALYTAQNYPVVGTSLEYFSFRKLEIAQGSPFAILGECVVGFRAAQSLNLKPGDQLLSDRENVLNLAGQTPLKLDVAGTLRATNTPDDWAVFVDLKTAWVIQGLGHGHQDLNKEAEDSNLLLGRTNEKITANAGVASYIEITPANVGSFHFHGEQSDFPITSVIAVSQDVKNETILQGRYGSRDSQVQFAKPALVFQDLMNLVFQIKTFFDANAILISVSTLLLLTLVVLLSLKLRTREMETMFKLGCKKGTIAALQFWELAIIFGLTSLLVGIASSGLWAVSGEIVEWLLIRPS
ncbi:MAG: hypothetical protein AAF623_11260 [Planctomycetota bacterium]